MTDANNPLFARRNVMSEFMFETRHVIGLTAGSLRGSNIRADYDAASNGFRNATAAR